LTSSRRRRSWADSRFANLVSSGGELTLTDLLEDLPGETRTVTRLIVDLTCGLSPSDENEGMQVIDCGIGVVSREAFDLGITAIPDPFTDTDFPTLGWLYVATRPITQALPTGGTVVTMWREAAVFQADLRAQRKVDRGVLFLRLSNTALLGTALSIRVTGRVRALCLT